MRCSWADICPGYVATVPTMRRTSHESHPSPSFLRWPHSRPFDISATTLCERRLSAPQTCFCVCATHSLSRPFRVILTRPPRYQISEYSSSIRPQTDKPVRIRRALQRKPSGATVGNRSRCSLFRAVTFSILGCVKWASAGSWRGCVPPDTARYCSGYLSANARLARAKISDSR